MSKNQKAENQGKIPKDNPVHLCEAMCFCCPSFWNPLPMVLDFVARRNAKPSASKIRAITYRF